MEFPSRGTHINGVLREKHQRANTVPPVRIAINERLRFRQMKHITGGDIKQISTPVINGI